MDERNDGEKMEEMMLPGFRFHPTDEELVGFYLKRKVQQRPLSIELIKQLDIYKYDPWDLPKMATLGEKEWYFYCPRDRKYRNSARPNRVTGAGFWKATGTDRPIYNSEGSKCIGLKKSLVFYKGRAAKGIKTDWMMHEFRLPSTPHIDSVSTKRYIDKNIPANDAWAICRIFKKTNSTAQRALSHSWVSPSFETISDITQKNVQNAGHLSSNDISMPTKASTPIQFNCSTAMNLDEKSSSLASFTPLDHVSSYRSMYQMAIAEPSQLSISNNELITNYTFSSSTETSPQPSKRTINDASSLLLNMSSSVFGDLGKASQNVEYDHIGEEHNYGSFVSVMAVPHQGMQQGHHIIGHGEEAAASGKDQNVVNVEEHLGTIRSVGFPYGLPLSLPDAWRSNLLWDSSPCPSEISTNYSTNQCNT